MCDLYTSRRRPTFPKPSRTTIKKFLHHCRRVSPPRASFMFFSASDLLSVFAPEPFNFYLSRHYARLLGLQKHPHPYPHPHPHHHIPFAHHYDPSTPFCCPNSPPTTTPPVPYILPATSLSPPRLTLISQCINYPRPNTCTINTGSPPFPAPPPVSPPEPRYRAG